MPNQDVVKVGSTNKTTTGVSGGEITHLKEEIMCGIKSTDGLVTY